MIRFPKPSIWPSIMKSLILITALGNVGLNQHCPGGEAEITFNGKRGEKGSTLWRKMAANAQALS